jgi:NAD(P)-dependent dehydrogenase (short-subunit alcohol dehydrogenase family)
LAPSCGHSGGTVNTIAGEMAGYIDKIAVVTGGGSGIGRAICTYLAERGAHVVAADRNPEGAEETVLRIRSAGGSAESQRVDVADPGEVESLIHGVTSRHGRIDYLFNNAGISINGEFQDLTMQHLQSVMKVNFWGTIYGCRSVYPIMKKQGFGHIVNTASLAGLIPGGLTSIYSASKHAVVGFSLTLRAEARQYGIKVSALCPGYMRTNIQKTTENVSAYMNSEKNRQMNAEMKFPIPEDCIDRMMRGVRRNRGIIVIPIKHKIYWWLHRIAPELIPNMFHRIIRMMKKPGD